MGGLWRVYTLKRGERHYIHNRDVCTGTASYWPLGIAKSITRLYPERRAGRVPEEGLKCLYIGSCPYRPTHLVKQMEAIDGCIHIVMIDISIEVTSTIRCKTGSVALNLSGT